MIAFDVNWLAIVAAAVVNMVIGGLWYSPMLFAGTWSKLSKAEMKATGQGFALTALAALVEAFALAQVVRWAGATTWMEGLTVGLFVAVGFIAAAMASNYIFGGRPLKLYLIDAGYFLLVLGINGIILTVWS